MNMNVFLTLLLTVFFSMQAAHSAEADGVDAKRIKIKGNKEILVGEDVGSGIWCGNNTIFASHSNTGVGFVEVPSGKKTVVGLKKNQRVLGCSRDGKWLIYNGFVYDRFEEDGYYTSVTREINEDDYLLSDLYRYEMSIGRHERIAVVYPGRTRSTILLSPDGKKIFLAGKQSRHVKMREPEWEFHRYSNKRVRGQRWEPRWLSDSSGVVSIIKDLPHVVDLSVDVFGKDGWTRRFKLVPMFNYNLTNVTVDKKNRIYFLDDPDMRRKYYSRRLNRCEIKGRELNCKTILERNSDITSYAILPNGEVVYKQEGRLCLYRIPTGKQHAECVVGNRYDGKVYDDIQVSRLSPDGKWLSFMRTKFESDKDPYIYDVPRNNYLFVIELKSE